MNDYNWLVGFLKENGVDIHTGETTDGEKIIGVVVGEQVTFFLFNEDGDYLRTKVL